MSDSGSGRGGGGTGAASLWRPSADFRCSSAARCASSRRRSSARRGASVATRAAFAPAQGWFLLAVGSLVLAGLLSLLLVVGRLPFLGWLFTDPLFFKRALVVHVDPPAEHKAYLHRSGRTARAGSAGDVVTVVLPEQRKDAQQLLRKAGITARPQEVVADSASVQALVGEIAPYRAPAPKETPAPRGGNRPAKTATAGQAQRRRRRSGGQQAPGRAQSGRSQAGRTQAR